MSSSEGIYCGSIGNMNLMHTLNNITHVTIINVPMKVSYFEYTRMIAFCKNHANKEKPQPCNDASTLKTIKIWLIRKFIRYWWGKIDTSLQYDLKQRKLNEHITSFHVFTALFYPYCVSILNKCVQIESNVSLLTTLHLHIKQWGKHNVLKDMTWCIKNPCLWGWN